MTKKKTYDHYSLKKSWQSRFGISTFKREKKEMRERIEREREVERHIWRDLDGNDYERVI